MPGQKISRKARRYLRRYAGQEAAQPLINFLNAGSEKAPLLIEVIDANAARRAVAEPVTRAMGDPMLTKLRVPAEVARAIRKFPSLDRSRKGYEDTFETATTTIKTILDKLSFTPLLVGSVRGRWVTQWRGRGLPGSEAEAFFKLLELGCNGLLHRVIRCQNPGCSQWLYAAPPWKRFHSQKCQEEVYEADPDRREARREWARKHYQNHVKGGR